MLHCTSGSSISVRCMKKGRHTLLSNHLRSLFNSLTTFWVLQSIDTTSDQSQDLEIVRLFTAHNNTREAQFRIRTSKELPEEQFLETIRNQRPVPLWSAISNQNAGVGVGVKHRSAASELSLILSLTQMAIMCSEDQIRQRNKSFDGLEKERYAMTMIISALSPLYAPTPSYAYTCPAFSTWLRQIFPRFTRLWRSPTSFWCHKKAQAVNL